MKPRLIPAALSALLLILLAFGESAVIGVSPTDIVSGSTTLVVSPPSSVTSATNSCCISTWGPINNLYLTFYYDNSAGWFRTCSATSCVWSSPTKIQTAGTFWFSAWLSGTNVYYLSSSNSADSNFYFRSGTINSNGSITWDYVGGQWLALRGEQKIGALNNANQPCSNVRGIYVSVDDSGVVWASFQCKDASGNYFFDVYSYSSNHSWNLRHMDSNGASSFEIGYTVPLTSGKLALLYQIRIVGQQGTNPNANVITWDGAGTWSQPVTTAAVVGQTSSTHNGDTLQFCSFGQNSLVLWTYIYGSLSWNSPVTVSPSLPTGAGGYNCAVTTDGTDMIILYGPESSSTYATLSTDIGSTWTPLTSIDSGLTASQRQTLPPTFSGTFTGLWYSKQSSNSNLLRYAIFSVETTTTTSTSTSSSTTISSSTTTVSSTTTNSTTSATTSTTTNSTTTTSSSTTSSTTSTTSTSSSASSSTSSTTTTTPLPSSLAIDGGGSNRCASSNTCSASITTTHTNDIIYAVCGGTAQSHTFKVTDTAGLSWTQRASQNTVQPSVSSWYAKAPNALNSDAVKCTLDSGTTNMAVSVVGISGANQSAPFDGNSAVPCEAYPGSGTSVSCGISTNNAKDMIIGVFVVSGGAPGTLTAGAGFTIKTSTGNTGPASGIEYEIANVTQTNSPVSVSWVTGGLRAVMIVDAIAG